MSDTKLTTEKKAELYDKIMEQRQQVIHYIYDLLDGFHSLELNYFGLSNEEAAKLTDPNNTHYKLFKEGCFNKVEAALKGFKRAELLEATCANWPIEKIERPYWMSPNKDIKKTKRWIVQKLLMFFNDFHIGKSDYPGCDIGVYEEYVSSLIYIALSSIGIEHDDKALLEFINEILPEDGKMLDDEGRDNWKCKSSVLLNDVVIAFNNFLNSNKTPETIREFADKFSSLYKRGIADKILAESHIECDTGLELPKLAVLPLFFGIKNNIVQDEEDGNRFFYVADVTYSYKDDKDQADADATVKKWAADSGLVGIESWFDTSKKVGHWMCKTEIKRPE